MATAPVYGETEIRRARQHWYVFLPALAVSLVVLVVIGVVIAVSPGDVAGHSLQLTKAAVGLAAALFVAVVLSLRWLRWTCTTFTLTDRRVLVSRGVISRYSVSVALDRVQDVRVRQGIVDRLFGAGDVEIQSAGRDGHEVLRHVRDPVGFRDAVQLTAQGLRTAQGGGAAWQPAAEASAVAPPAYVPPPTAPPRYLPPGAGAASASPPAGYNPPRRGSA